MKPTPTKLHVVLDERDTVLGIYRAPRKDHSISSGEAFPDEGGRVVEIEAVTAYDDLKSFEEAHELVKPHIKTATLVRLGSAIKPWHV